ncbi:MAG: Gfo/Idh/MocA family oxidoreductase [Sedimentisphaerales bacterium]|nr:Gfo/Idh/MocA family oxidoreductase [Sedimentisphaerales bacterium]
MKNLNRRVFLKGTVLGAGTLAVPNIVPASVFGADAPSNRIVMASIGTGGQGRGNMGNLMQYSDCQVVAVCDVDANHCKEAANQVNNHYNNSDCKEYNDFREVIARRDIDAVCISTPDHWHGLITIAAAKAGKDIYCEKPLTNSIFMGQAVYRTVKRYGRVFQTGSHERSREKARFACELVQNGYIGKLHTIVVNLPCIEPHHKSVMNDTGDHPVLSVPPELDWDMWLGYTPLVPYTPKRCHFSWRFVMAYGAGEMSDRGAHVIDIGQLGNNTDDTTPIEFWAKGELPKSKLFDTYFNFQFEARYANGVKMVGTSEEPRGVKFIGDDGWVFVHIHGGHLEASDPKLLTTNIKPDEIHLGRSKGHHRNFLDSVKTREETMAPIHVGYHTLLTCQLLNISMMLDGARFKWDPSRERVLDNPRAQALLKRPMRAPWTL